MVYIWHMHLKDLLFYIYCIYKQSSQLAFTKLSDLYSNRLHVKAIKWARRQEQRHNSPPNPGHIMHPLKEPMAFHENWKCVRHQGDRASFDLGYSMEHRGPVEDVGKWNCSVDDPKSNLSRHRSKCASSAGMHQSAEPIKDSFYCWSTPLLTLCFVVRAGRSIACQLLTVWLKWNTSSFTWWQLPLKWPDECLTYSKELTYTNVTDQLNESVIIVHASFFLFCFQLVWKSFSGL